MKSDQCLLPLSKFWFFFGLEGDLPAKVVLRPHESNETVATVQEILADLCRYIK